VRIKESDLETWCFKYSDALTGYSGLELIMADPWQGYKYRPLYRDLIDELMGEQATIRLI